jgi:hypothetical protein
MTTFKKIELSAFLVAVLLFLLSLSLPAHSQPAFFIRTGVTIGKMQNVKPEHYGSSYEKTYPYFGFSAIAGIDYTVLRIGKSKNLKLSFVNEVGYVERPSSTFSTYYLTVLERFKYLELPFLIRFSIGKCDSSKAFAYINAGGALGYGLGYTHHAFKSGPTHLSFREAYLNLFDLATQLGAGFGLKAGPGYFLFDFRYSKSFTNIVGGNSFGFNGDGEIENWGFYSNSNSDESFYKAEYVAFTVGYSLFLK